MKQVVDQIDQYLSGETSARDVAAWATLKMGKEPYHTERQQTEDYIIANALGALMMLSESEPEEFRSTQEDLLEARRYLTGEEPFPSTRIPE